MADNITAPAQGAVLATDEIGGVHYPRTKVSFGANGSSTDVSTADRLPVALPTGFATEAKQDDMIAAIENISPGGGGGGDASAANQTAVQANAGADASKAISVQFITGGKALAVTGTFFQATQPVSGTVSISGSVAVTGPLTDTQLRATALPVSGTFWQATQPVSIAGTVAVSGPLTDTQLRATAVPVSGPLTDTQLRATAVPVSVGGSVAVTGTFYQATQPVSAASLPLPTGAGTSAKQDTIITALGTLGTQTTLAAILAKLIAAPSTEAKQDALIALATLVAGTDRSGSITTGGTAQQLAAANSARKSLTIQNISDVDMWVNEIGGTAAADTAGSWKVTAGSAFAVSTNRAISIVAATTGKKFTATEI